MKKKLLLCLTLACFAFVFSLRAQAECCSGDLTGDCLVDLADIRAFAGYWLDTPAASGSDLTGDGEVDFHDFAVILEQWLQKETAELSVQISEFMADNDSVWPLEPGEILDGNLESSDWIEIHNDSEVPVDLSRWYLTDDFEKKTQWQFPQNANCVIQPGDYLVLFASGKTQADNPGNYPYLDKAGYLHTNFNLSKKGEYLALIDPEGETPVHEYNHFDLGKGKYGYPQQQEDFSYGLYNGETRYFAKATPGADNSGPILGFVEEPDVNIEGGCYRGIIELAMTCGTPGASIRYTTDGTPPSLTHGTYYTSPIHISSLTTIVAGAFKAGYQQSETRIETYIFLDREMPSFSSNLPIIVVDTLGRGIPNLKDAPTAEQYVDCRAVIIDVDDATGRSSIPSHEHFSGLGQIRRRGESTYGQGHFAFEVQDESRQDKDVSLLGMPAESDWILSYDVIDYTMMKNELAFQWFRDMGHYAPRQRYVEVYLNTRGGPLSASDYKGLFMLREKIKHNDDRVDIKRLNGLHNQEPHITGGYIFKNDKQDADDLPLDLETAPYGIVIDGVTSLVEPREPTAAQLDWISNYLNEFHSVLWQNHNSSYYPGRSADYTDYVEQDSWIDHLIVEQIGFDADAFRFSFFVHKDRDGRLASGPPWDFDRAFHNNGGNYGRPFDRWAHAYKLPWAWHKQLLMSPEYSLNFADRWFRHRKDVLNTAAAMQYIDQTAALISEARSRPRKTYPRPFEEEVRLFKTWITNRLNWMDQKIADDFAQRPPVISPVGGYFDQLASIEINRPAGVSGTIYYTTNGEDPRLTGGVNPNALVFSRRKTESEDFESGVDGTDITSGSIRDRHGLTLSKSTCVRARIKIGSGWSAENREVYAVGPVREHLRISELMYHPADPIPEEMTAAGDPDLTSEDFEFVELQNIGTTDLNLNLVHFTDGIDYTFSDHTVAAGRYVVLVKNQAAFAARYDTAGIDIVGCGYSGYFDNDGEGIVLRDALGAEIHDFGYKDSWFELTDGGGLSLTIFDAVSTDPDDWNSKSAWRSSINANGTPGQM